MKTIQPLPIDLVQLIAAGEVIDSLAAAVRELIDNALDAGATRISIAVWPQEWRLRVTDNGMGMTVEDLQSAATTHTTSKIHESQDLWQINTLGFRGQALHSLAQLGHLEICSRRAIAESGWRVVYNHQGAMVESQPMAIAPGTIVSLDHLFADWPVRRQGLSSVARQLRAIQQVVHQSALCHPRVTWQVQQQERPWFSIAPGKSAQEILVQLLATVQPTDLRSLQQPHLELTLGLPDRCHRQRPDWVRLAVNGRCVETRDHHSTPSLLGHLEQGMLLPFQRTLPRHRYPVCFVHLQVPPAEIDWNRHPAKTEVYLQTLEVWQQRIQEAIEHTLGLPATPTTEPIRQLIKAAEPLGMYRLDRTIQSTPDLPDAEAISAPHRSQLRAVAQIHGTYILAEHPRGLWLVEQHIAHERVLYEQLCQHWQLVELATPLTLRHLRPTQIEQLQQLGIDLEPFGTDVWAVRSAPAAIAHREDLAAALVELSLATHTDDALVATACRSAIRNGTPLSLIEMQHLLEQWQASHHPRTCPHGRPICLILEETSLARFFRRNWVIGKSHGI